MSLTHYSTGTNECGRETVMARRWYMLFIFYVMVPYWHARDFVVAAWPVLLVLVLTFGLGIIVGRFK